jgi:hypothetical protein
VRKPTSATARTPCALQALTALQTNKACRSSHCGCRLRVQQQALHGARKVGHTGSAFCLYWTNYRVRAEIEHVAPRTRALAAGRPRAAAVRAAAAARRLQYRRSYESKAESKTMARPCTRPAVLCCLKERPSYCGTELFR